MATSRGYLQSSPSPLTPSAAAVPTTAKPNGCSSGLPLAPIAVRTGRRTRKKPGLVRSLSLDGCVPSHISSLAALAHQPGSIPFTPWLKPHPLWPPDQPFRPSSAPRAIAHSPDTEAAGDTHRQEHPSRGDADQLAGGPAGDLIPHSPQESLSTKALRLSNSLRAGRLRAVDLHKQAEHEAAALAAAGGAPLNGMNERAAGQLLQHPHGSPMPQDAVKKAKTAVLPNKQQGAMGVSSAERAMLGTADNNTLAYLDRSIEKLHSVAPYAVHGGGEGASMSLSSFRTSSSPSLDELSPSLRMLVTSEGSSAGPSPAPLQSPAATVRGVYGVPTPLSRSLAQPSGRAGIAAKASEYPAVSSGGAFGGGINGIASGGANALVVTPSRTEVREGSDTSLRWENIEGLEGFGDDRTGQDKDNVEGAQAGLKKMISKGAVTRVKFVRRKAGEDDGLSDVDVPRSDDGISAEGMADQEGNGLLQGSGGTATIAAGEAGASQGSRKEASSREEVVCKAQDEGVENNAGSLFAPVEAGDLDLVLGKLELRYDITGDEETVVKNVRALLSLGARRGQVLRVVARQPGLLCRPIDEEAMELAGVFRSYRIAPMELVKAMGRSLDFLAVHAEQVDAVLGFLDRNLGVNNLGSVVATCPQLLAQSASEIGATVSFLKGLDVADVGAALEENPSLLGMGVRDVEEKVLALEGLVKGTGAVRRMMKKRSELMLANPEEAKDAFDRLVRLLGEEIAMEVVVAQPQLLATTGDMVEHAVGDMVGHFGEALTGSILAENGSIVRRKWDKVAAKIHFLLRVMERDVDQVAAWPKVLTFNLQSRLRRRFDVLQANFGPEAGKAESLRSLFGCTDATFERRFNVRFPALPKGRRGRKQKVRADEGDSNKEDDKDGSVARMGGKE